MKMKKCIARMLISATILGSVSVTMCNHTLADEEIKQGEVGYNQFKLSDWNYEIKDQYVILKNSNIHVKCENVTIPGEITINQLSMIQMLDLCERNIHNLDGIQYCTFLTDLTEFVDVNGEKEYKCNLDWNIIYKDGIATITGY